MDSENTKQHDNHVQRGDGHEQDDENPQNGRDKRQEHSGAVEHDTKERHEQNEADDGSDHVRDRDRQRAVSRRDRAVVSRPAAAVDFPAGQAGGVRATYISRINGSFVGPQPNLVGAALPGSRSVHGEQISEVNGPSSNSLRSR